MPRLSELFDVVLHPRHRLLLHGKERSFSQREQSNF